MPELYITRRKENTDNGNIAEWKRIYEALSLEERKEFIGLISENSFPHIEIKNDSIRNLYERYAR